MLIGAWADAEPARPAGRGLPDARRGHAERVAALHMIEPRADRPRTITVGADKATMRKTLSTSCARWTDTACGAEHQQPQFCHRRGERPVTAAIPSASASASALRRHLAGSRRAPDKSFGAAAPEGLLLRCRCYNLVRLPKLIAEAA